MATKKTDKHQYTKQNTTPKTNDLAYPKMISEKNEESDKIAFNRTTYTDGQRTLLFRNAFLEYQKLNKKRTCSILKYFYGVMMLKTYCIT